MVPFWEISKETKCRAQNYTHLYASLFFYSQNTLLQKKLAGAVEKGLWARNSLHRD